MVRHLLSHGMPGHARTTSPTIDAVGYMFWNRHEESKRMLAFSLTARRLPLGKGTLCLPTHFRLLALALYAPADREFIEHRQKHARASKPRSKNWRNRGSQSTAEKRLFRAKQLLRRSGKSSEGSAGADKPAAGKGKASKGQPQKAVGKKPTEKIKGEHTKLKPAKAAASVAPPSAAAPVPADKSVKGKSEWPSLPQPKPSPKRKQRVRGHKRQRSAASVGSDLSDSTASTSRSDSVWKGEPTSLGTLPKRRSARVVVDDASSVGTRSEPVAPTSGAQGSAAKGAAPRCAKIRVIDQDLSIEVSNLVGVLDAEHATRATEAIRVCVEGLVNSFVEDFRNTTRRVEDLVSERTLSRDDEAAAAARSEIERLKKQVAILTAQRCETAEALAGAEMHFEATFGRKLKGWSGSCEELSLDGFTVEQRLRGCTPVIRDAVKKAQRLSERRRSPSSSRSREPSVAPSEAPSLDSLKLSSPARPAATRPPEEDVAMDGQSEGSTIT